MIDPPPPPLMVDSSTPRPRRHRPAASSTPCFAFPATNSSPVPRAEAYDDHPLPSATIKLFSQPYVGRRHARIAQLIRPTPSSNRHGSGYVTALLAELAAQVFSSNATVPRLQRAHRSCRDGLCQCPRVHRRRYTWSPAHAPFDASLSPLPLNVSPTLLLNSAKADAWSSTSAPSSPNNSNSFA